MSPLNWKATSTIWFNQWRANLARAKEEGRGQFTREVYLRLALIAQANYVTCLAIEIVKESKR